MWEATRQPRNLFAFGRFNLMPGPEPFLNHVGRVHDVSAQLALARASLSEPVLDDAALERMAEANPYGRDYGIRLDREEEQLCFDGPLEDRAESRCIPVPANRDANRDYP